MPLSFARSALVAVSLVLVPVAVTAVIPVPASAQAFSALRQVHRRGRGGRRGVGCFLSGPRFRAGLDRVEAADRRNALLRALEQAGAHGLAGRPLRDRALRAAFRDATNPWLRGQADVMASRIFLQYAQDVHGGFLDPSTIIPDIFQDQPHRDPYALMTEFLDSNPHQFMDTLPPQTPGYTRLMRTKFQLEELAANGGYGPTVQAGSLRPGDAGPAVVQLRNRLMRMGYLDRSATAEVRRHAAGVLSVAFQTNHGITADGIAGEATIRAVNRSIEDHWNEIVLSMERHRWLNDGQVHDRLIYVNLTDFHTRVIDDGEVTFVTRSVIGARDRQTPEFSDEMEHMVINPSWYVPRSIAQRSYIPGILAGRGTYMQLLSRAGGL